MKTKNCPTFSVVVPTYNRATILKRSIESVLQQSFKDFELVIIDDCSTDNTYEIIREFIEKDGRVRFLKLEENVGGAAARNRGIISSIGEYIAFLDSDDEASQEWLKKAYNKIQTLPETWGVVYPRYSIKDELTGIVYWDTISPKEGNIYKNLMRGEGLAIGTSGAVVRRKVLEEVSGFDEKLPGFHDFDLWYRLSKNWDFYFLNAPLIISHQHQNSRLSEENKKRNEAMLLFSKKWDEEIKAIAGKNAIIMRQQKRGSGIFFYEVRREIIKGGRFAGMKFLLRTIPKKKIKSTYLLKVILILLIGPRFYDITRRWRGILYWSLKKS